MIIQSDNLLAHLEERIVQISMQCVGDKTKSYEDTMFDRGRYAGYKELINYINTNYSSE